MKLKTQKETETIELNIRLDVLDAICKLAEETKTSIEYIINFFIKRYNIPNRKN